MYISPRVNDPLFCHILMELEFFWQIFEKYPSIKFHENPSHVSRAVPCGRTDGHDEANSRFSLFCEDAWKREPHEYAAGCYLANQPTTPNQTRPDQTRLRQDQTRLIIQLKIDKTSHTKQCVRFVSSNVPPLFLCLMKPCHVICFRKLLTRGLCMWAKQRSWNWMTSQHGLHTAQHQ